MIGGISIRLVILVALVTAATLIVVPSGAQYAPAPGHVYVYNGLTGSMQSCEGEIAVRYGLMAVEKQSRATVTVLPTCAIAVDWGENTNSAPFTAADVILTISDLAVNSGEWELGAAFERLAGGCPLYVPGSGWSDSNSGMATSVDNNVFVASGGPCHQFITQEWTGNFEHLDRVQMWNGVITATVACDIVWSHVYDPGGQSRTYDCTYMRHTQQVEIGPFEIGRIVDNLLPGQSTEVPVNV